MRGFIEFSAKEVSGSAMGFALSVDEIRRFKPNGKLPQCRVYLKTAPYIDVDIPYEELRRRIEAAKWGIGSPEPIELKAGEVLETLADPQVEAVIDRVAKLETTLADSAEGARIWMINKNEFLRHLENKIDLNTQRLDGLEKKAGEFVKVNDSLQSSFESVSASVVSSLRNKADQISESFEWIRALENRVEQLEREIRNRADFDEQTSPEFDL